MEKSKQARINNAKALTDELDKIPVKIPREPIIKKKQIEQVRS